MWIRALDSLEVRPLSDTEAGMFFWSPDSRFIVFHAGGKLKKLDISGGTAQTICATPAYSVGGSWNREGVIIYGVNSVNLMRVPAAGGAPVNLTKLNLTRQESGHYFPVFLPDGRHFLYWCESAVPEYQGIYTGSLDVGPEEQGSRQLLAADYGLVYVPSQDSGPGQLLFMRGQTLLAQPFDDKRLELAGEPVIVAEPVGSYLDYGLFTASSNGVVVYRGGSSQLTQPTWFDRHGKSLATVGDPGLYYVLTISPDGTSAAVGKRLPNALIDVWLVDLLRGINTRFTFGRGHSSRPVWSPDANHIIFNSDREGSYNLYQKASSGTEDEKLLLKSNQYKAATSWSGDGQFLLYTALDHKTKTDLWVLPLKSGGKEIPFLRTEFNEGDGHFSPDGRWVAYVSDESGNNEIYVRGFSPSFSGSSPAQGGKVRVSNGGGQGPRWRKDGKEMYYRTADGTVMAMEVAAGSTFQAGTPKPLFRAPADYLTQTSIASFPAWDVTSDGNRFLLPVPAADSAPPPFTIILNWTALLDK